MKILPLKNDVFCFFCDRKHECDEEELRFRSCTVKVTGKFIIFKYKFIILSTQFMIVNTKFMIFNTNHRVSIGVPAEYADSDALMQVSKHDEFCTKNEELCIENDEFCRCSLESVGFCKAPATATRWKKVSVFSHEFLLKNDDFLLKNDDFLLKNVEFIIQMKIESTGVEPGDSWRLRTKRCDFEWFSSDFRVISTDQSITGMYYKWQDIAAVLKASANRELAVVGSKILEVKKKKCRDNGGFLKNDEKKCRDNGG